MEMLKLRSPYFTSVTQHSHVTNKPEADGELILPRPLSSSVLRFTGIEATYSYTESKEESASTNCVNPSS